MKTIMTSLAIFLVFAGPLALAATADYSNCKNRVSGEWNFARAPQACDVSAWGSDSVVVQDFGKVIFDDSLTRTSERTRYMQELDAVIQEAATYYLQKRKPAVSQDELSWWVLAMRATAAQESYWSHYRRASDGRLKMMRGDVGHGHGMMQIDDRSHFPAISEGVGWNLALNLAYGMDVFFKAWEKAPSQSCVGSPTNWEARTRSAWSAYNGGMTKLCRFADSSSAWAAHDQSFYSNLRNMRWASYVGKTSKASAVNITCLMEKKENCPAVGMTSVPVQTPALQDGVLYKNSSNGQTCVLDSSRVRCVSEFRDAICLRAYQDVNLAQVQTMALTSTTLEDRHVICRQYDSTVYPVGSTVVLKKSLNLRSTPGGGILAVVPVGTSVTVLDFEIRNPTTRERYYRVRYQTQVGYLYAGTSQDYAQWIQFQSVDANSSLAKVGSVIEVVNAVGINLRATAGGTLISAIPVKTRLSVSKVTVSGTENKVYYQVTYNGKTGFIYTGLLKPTDTTSQWTRIVN